MRESNTGWIIGSLVVASFGGTVLAAASELAIHWYVAVALAAALIGGGGLAYAVEARVARREGARRAEEKAAIEDGIRRLCRAIEDNARRFEAAATKHAVRMEKATDSHGARLQGDIFTIMANTWRGEALAASDAREAAARDIGGETGPMRAVSGR